MAIIIPILADTTQLARALGRGTSSIRKFGFLAGAAIATGVVLELRKSALAAIESEKAATVLAGRLKTIGAGGEINRLNDQFQRLADTLGVDDEAASGAFGRILQSTHDTTSAMQGLNLALDISASQGFTNLDSVAVKVAKTLAGSNRLFKEYGIEIDKNASKQERLAALQQAFAGQAENYGTSAAGSFARFNVAVENLRESVGGPLVGALAIAGGKLASFINELRAQPTLRAKIEFLIGTFQGIFWRGFASVVQWWEGTSYPLDLMIRPKVLNGRESVEKIYQELRVYLNSAGQRLGAGLGHAVLGAFAATGKDGAGATVAGIVDKLNSVGRFLFQLSGGELAASLLSGIVTGLQETLGPALKNVILQAIRDMISVIPGDGLAKEKFLGILGMDAVGRRAFKGIVTRAVREAVQSARQAMSGMGSSIGAMLSQITGSSSPAAIAAANIRKQQAIEKAAREKKALLDAVAGATTDEERAQATQDLNDFLIEQEATRLEQSVSDQQTANQTAIDNLIEQFNVGAISAQNFADQLNGIIGADRGAALGSAFAGAFGREIAGIIASARDIQSVVGQGVPIVAGGSTVASDAARQAHADWVRRRRERRALAVKNKRTPEEIRAIMEEWNNANPEPVRMAMGGILRKQVFTAGESGPEAVIPLGSNQAMSMLRDAIGGGGGGATYNLTVNAGLGTNPDELGRVIVESIKKYERRNGQVFMGPSIQATSLGVSTSGGVQTRARSIR